MNANYEDFLGLGGQLKGGEERVEEVRLGVLGFGGGEGSGGGEVVGGEEGG